MSVSLPPTIVEPIPSPLEEDGLTLRLRATSAAFGQFVRVLTLIEEANLEAAGEKKDGAACAHADEATSSAP